MGKLPAPHMIELENQNVTATETSQQKKWITAHPFTAVLACAGSLLLFGAVVVLRHSAANPAVPGINAWGGDITATLDPAGTVTTPDQGDILHQVQNSPPYTYTIPPLTGASQPQSSQSNDDSFDYKKFMSGIGQQKSTGALPPKGVTDITYAFPPASLFVASTATTDKTPVQQALYNYGNEVGSYIESYEQAHPDQAQVLKNQIEDQSNPEKVKAVVQMGHDLEAIGTNLLAMEEVPSQISAAHTTLAKSYQTIGQNLALVPLSKSTDDLLAAIKVYNTSADVFAKNFVSLVSTFSTYGVTFSAEDPGRVFTFTYSSGM